jgi:hypothetical protein
MIGQLFYWSVCANKISKDSKIKMYENNEMNESYELFEKYKIELLFERNTVYIKKLNENTYSLRIVPRKNKRDGLKDTNEEKEEEDKNEIKEGNEEEKENKNIKIGEGEILQKEEDSKLIDSFN